MQKSSEVVITGRLIRAVLCLLLKYPSERLVSAGSGSPLLTRLDHSLLQVTTTTSRHSAVGSGCLDVLYSHLLANNLQSSKAYHLASFIINIYSLLKLNIGDW